MILAERIPNGLVIDVGERLKRLHDRRADGRLPGVEGAMRLSASRNLPDAIVGHQRQRAVDIVSVHHRAPGSREAGLFRHPTNLRAPYPGWSRGGRDAPPASIRPAQVFSDPTPATASAPPAR